MKTLIVLTALATLLGSSSGCSMFRRSDAQSCAPTSSATSVSRSRLPRISLPWRRAQGFDQGSGECSTCKEGFSESGFVNGQTINNSSFGLAPMMEGQVIGEEIIDGRIINGSVIDEGFIDTTVNDHQSLYHPEVVGPISTTSGSSPTYAGELIPRPASPVIDLGK